MKKTTVIILVIVAIVAIVVGWFISTGNRLVREEESVTSAWQQVESVYQRRYDLIPQLVNTVKGAANFEKNTFLEVTQARTQASGVTGGNLSEEEVRNFQQAQDKLGASLSRSINVVMEAYPQLTATQEFANLQAQLEGTENRISVERQKYNDVVRQYNSLIRQFPTSIVASMRGFERKGYFTATAGAENAVQVEFDL